MNAKKKVSLGSFFEDDQAGTPAPRQVPTAASSEHMVKGLALIQSELSPPAAVIYYPACGYDCSPSQAWPDSRVVYADIDERAIVALRDANLEAVCEDALEFDPGPVDILLMLNPEIDPAVPSGFVVPGGLVICNDYHRTATKLRRMSAFELLGLVRTGEQGQVILDRRQPELYWEEVQTDEELRKAPMSWGGTGYDAAARIVELETGGKTSIVTEYRRILAAERVAQGTSPDNEPLWFVAKGESHLLSRLPGRKGTADSLFVFRRL